MSITQYLFPLSKVSKLYPQKVSADLGTYQCVLLFTLYIRVYTSWTTCTISWEWAGILKLGYHNTSLTLPVWHPTGQTHKNVCFKVSRKFCKDQYIPVCTSDVKVHTNVDHIHTFISNQVLSPLTHTNLLLMLVRCLVGSFLPSKFLPQVFLTVMPPRRDLPRPNCHNFHLNLMNVAVSPASRVCTNHKETLTPVLLYLLGIAWVALPSRKQGVSTS